MNKIFSILLSFQLILSPLALAAGKQNENEVSENKTIDYAKYGKIIFNLSHGIVGTQILKACKNQQPSLVVYMIGSTAYIGNEIFEALERAFIYQAERSEMNVAELSPPGPDATAAQRDEYIKAQANIQIQAQEKMRDDAKRDLKTFKRKEIISWAISSVYGIALAISIIEAIASLPPPAGISNPGEGVCVGPTGPSAEKLAQAVVMAYQISSVAQSATNTGIQISKILKEPLNVGSFLSTGMGAYGTYKGLHRLLTHGTKGAEKGKVLLSNPWSRVAAYAAILGIVSVISADVSAERVKAKKRVDELDKVISQMEGDVTTNGLETEAGGSGPEQDPKKDSKKYQLTTLASGQVPRHCWSQQSEGVELSQAGCTKPIRYRPFNFGDLKLNNANLVKGLQLVNDLGNYAAAGDMAKFDASAASLAAMSGKIKEINKELLEKLNIARASAKEKPLDIEKEAKAITSSMLADFNQANGGSFPSLSLSPSAPEEVTLPKSSEVTITTASAPTSVPLSSPGQMISDGLGEENADGEKKPKLEETLEDFESPVQDISRQSDVSLFKQLSNRYILNYTKMFEQKKVLPEVVPEKK